MILNQYTKCRPVIICNCFSQFRCLLTYMEVIIPSSEAYTGLIPGLSWWATLHFDLLLLRLDFDVINGSYPYD